MSVPNPGLEPAEIEKIKQKCRQANQSYILNEAEPQGEEFAHFLFVGNHEGKEVIFDAVMYTLRLHHSSVLYEIAEDKACEQFPHYKKWDFEENENGEMVLPEDLDEEVEMFKADVMAELEESESVKVKEYVQIDTDFDYGYALEVCLNVEEITEADINKFVKDFNANALQLDETLYTFHHEDEDED
jgi:hypothetical protein